LTVIVGVTNSDMASEKMITVPEQKEKGINKEIEW
jgi:hypothetical protein